MKGKCIQISKGIEGLHEVTGYLSREIKTVNKQIKP